MATSGPITYLVMEDQFPVIAAPRERLPEVRGIGDAAALGQIEQAGVLADVGCCHG
jgi:hypothetical protein